MSRPSWIGYTLGGRYKIEALLGQGGMSAVYRAYDPNVRRTVAVKLIHPHLSSNPEFVRRFEIEAAAVGQLRHPNIVQVFDFDHDEDVYYMVMEFVPGESLYSRLRTLSNAGQRYSAVDTASLVASISDAVAYAHQHGTIHRDLKPANVILMAPTHPVLTDFGVAKILGGQQHTATGAILGTPVYMSPEQIRGDEIDGRTDIYSLGILLYEMATGRPPFAGDSDRAIMRQHLLEPVPDVPLMAAGTPNAFREIVVRALAKKPDDRYQDAAELAASLRAIVLRPYSPADRATIIEPRVADPVAPQPRAPAAPPPPAAVSQPRPSIAAQPAPSSASMAAPPSAALPRGPVSVARPTASRPPWLLPGVAAVLIACLLLSALLASVGGTAYLSRLLGQTRAATPTLAARVAVDDLPISGLNAYADARDYFHVVGLVTNESDVPASNVALTLQATDENGTTVLRDADDNAADTVDFSPMLATLAPGESSPFDYFVPASGADTSAWQFGVEVTAASPGQVNRAQLEVRNDQLVEDDLGNLYLTGELFNLSAQPALVSGLAGAVDDGGDTIYAAAPAYNVTRYLAATGDVNGDDSTPFVIPLDGPVASTDQWTFYLDADQTDPLSIGNEIKLDIVRTYVDIYDEQHLLATVTNTGRQTLSVALVAGLYDKDGTVLDATGLGLPIYIGPGETLPVSMENFSNVDNNATELDRVQSSTLQVDAASTFATSGAAVTLETDQESITDDGNGQVTFTGQVVNSSGQDLSSAALILALYDPDGDLMGASYASVYPSGDTLAAGDSLPFELTMVLAPNTDTTNYTFATFVQGYTP